MGAAEDNQPSNEQKHTVVNLAQQKKSQSQSSVEKPNQNGFNAPLHLWQHEASIEQVLNSVDSDLKTGLTTKEATHRLEKHGLNSLTERPASQWWQDLLSHFTDMFSVLLQFAALLSLASYIYDSTDEMHLYLFLFLCTVVILTSLFTFFQQRRSDRTLREFRNFLPPKAVVIRDEQEPMLVDADRLVVGDIIRITTGDRIPADVRLLSCDDAFAVDCASLTGESVPIPLNADPCMKSTDINSTTDPNDTTNPLEASNLAFFGCFAVEGSCTAVVIAIGDCTIFGRIAKLTTSDEAINNNKNGKRQNQQPKTTLQRDIQHFVLSISAFSIAVGVICFFIGLYLRVRLAQNIVYTLGIIVSNIPEGLLATVTVSLTASARRMAKKNILVRNLHAIETLGATDVIVTDKTGTLTQARMTVAHASFGGTVHTVASSDWKPPTDKENDVKKAFIALLHDASVCSSAFFERIDDNENKNKENGEGESVFSKEKSIRGDASETGVLRFTEKLHNTMAYRSRLNIITKVPFNSRDKFMITVDNSSQDECPNILIVNSIDGEEENENEKTKKCIDRKHGSTLVRVVMKGAPERVLQHCDSILSAGGMRELSINDRHLIDRQIAYFAQRGERVLAYAEKWVQKSIFDEDDDSGDLSASTSSFSSKKEQFFHCVGRLSFIGLLSLTDPPREGVPDAIRTLKAAGIKVLMITGDHSETALAIAQTAGVVTRSVSQPSLTIPVEPDDEMPEPHKAVIINGNILSSLTDTQWTTLLNRDEAIFARASPQHKLEIVHRLQEMGHIVTATGDGCNDAPALKAANAGIAMGQTGSDVSRSAADVILLDDDISNIVHGVREGRLIFDNLKKSVAYTLTSNVPQLLPFLAFVMFRLPLPITTALILCIDLGTDVFPAIALAYEKSERNILQRSPRASTGDRLLTWRLISFSTLQLGMLQTFAGFIAYMALFIDAGLLPSALPGLARHAFFASLRPTRQRWLIGEQSRAIGIASVDGNINTGSAFRASFFSRLNSDYTSYFSRTGIPSGFKHVRTDEYKSLRMGSSSFGNMLKITGAELQRPPCASYVCNSVSRGRLRNDISCFDPILNTGPILLEERLNSRNDAVIPGHGAWEGCFELWTPYRQRRALRSAQTAFFIAVVVAQVFTLFACRTRVVSVIPRLFDNACVWFALLAEIVVVVIIVYVPPVANALHVVPISWKYWMPAVPFGFFIVFYDEIRKWFIRKHVDNVSGLIVPRNDFVDRVARWVHDYTFW